VPPQRHPKRERKKQAAAVRRQALLEARRRRRRSQRLTLAAVTGALVLGGGALVFLTTVGNSPKATPAPSTTPTPAPSPAPIACDGNYPATAGSPKKSYSNPADQKLNKKKSYVLRLDTSCGQIDIKLALDKAPKTVNSVVFLARNGFYDGLTFHRIVSGFVVQGGDPKGDGGGGPGYKVLEAPPKTTKYTKGVVAMAKTGTDAPGTSGSQFFIVSGAEAKLPAEYALLGQVVAGLDAVDKIAGYAGDAGPTAKVFIERASIVEQ
jgi:cyclophilin family peptidyl-prolyl cis-trans isomerase